MLKSEILTPALLLDLDAFEANLARMMDRVKSSGKAIRPHAKAHKCVEIDEHVELPPGGFRGLLIPLDLLDVIHRYHGAGLDDARHLCGIGDR